MTHYEFEEAFPVLLNAARAAAQRVLHDPNVVDDVAADALARTWLHWRTVRELDRPDAWVCRVAINLAIDAGRSSTRRRLLLRRLAPQHTPPPEHGDLDLMTALRSLPTRQRDVIVLRYLLDMSEAEVASALRLTLSTVKQHGLRGRRTLRSHALFEGEDGC